MCRLLYIPAHTSIPFKQLLSSLRQLEKSFGGDGNGVATTRGTFAKGVGLPVYRAAQLLHGDSNAHAIFHTRKTSMGGTVDKLCHPFLTRRGGFLAHNGHWSEVSLAQKLFGREYSDTRLAARYITMYSWERFADVCDSGVWMYLKNNGIYIHYASGSLHVHDDTGIVASEPCFPGTWYEAAYGTYKPGEPIPEAKKTTIPSFPWPTSYSPSTHWNPTK